MVGFFDLSLNTSNLKEKVISKFFKNSCIKLCASLKSDNSWCETFKFFHRNCNKAFKSPYHLYRKTSKIHQKKNNEDMMLKFWKLNECNIRKKEYTTTTPNFRSSLYFLWMTNALIFGVLYLENKKIEGCHRWLFCLFIDAEYNCIGYGKEEHGY